MRAVAVSLDVTRTLLHAPRLGEIYAGTLARHGVTIAPEAVRRTMPVVWRELAREAPAARDRFGAHPGGARGFWHELIVRICELAGAAPPPAAATAELFARFAEPAAWRLFPEVPETLAALAAAGVRLAVVSNWDERLPLLLDRLGLAPRFRAIVTSAAVGWEKPHPAIFARAVAALGVAPEEVVHVGDDRREDVAGARAAGLQALHLDRGGEGDLASLAELPGWLGI